jgi:putative peptidoglycan lipid II flippase
LSEEVKPAPEKSDRGTLMRSAGLISFFTLLSRLLGVAREQVFAALLGAGLYADAFQVAFRIPNLLRDLFAEGALSAAFVPTYARARAEGGPERAHRLASRLFTLLAVILGALVLLGMFGARPLVHLMARGFDEVPGKTDATVFMTRVMLPFLPLVSFAAVAMGMLNADGRFGAPAASPAMFNVVTIAWGALLWKLGFAPYDVAVGWAVGTLLGGAAQFLIQVPPLRSGGWRFRPEWAPGDPYIRQIAGLMAPATIGLGAVQLNILVGTFFASHEPGAVSWLQYAFRVLYLPIGIFGVAVGTVATSGLARQAAAGDLSGMRTTVRHALGTLAFLTIPATVGLMVLAQPIIRLLFERGLFLPSDTAATATALAFYSIGLVFYTNVKVLAPAFYALGTPRVPLLASMSAVATNLVVIFALHDRLGFRAIALGQSLGSIVNALLLLAILHRRLAGLVDRTLLGHLAGMVLCAALMAPVTWWVAGMLEVRLGTRGLAAQLMGGLVPVVAGAVVYAVAGRALRLPEMHAILGSLRRRRPPA